MDIGVTEQTVLEILKSHPKHEMGLVTLSKMLSADKTLGFGVETLDIIFTLAGKKLISYDINQDLVKLC